MKGIAYKPVIGLEVHIELATKSKMFCRCSADHFAKLPNTNTCPTCLGLPGAMPNPNKEAIKNTLLFGLSLGCKLNTYSKFDRKHYFYPDLPKGYQISQYEFPFCKEGLWKSKSGNRFRIRRIHLEEDTGKLQHQDMNGTKATLIDFNRSGVPLMELVTDPDFSDMEDVLSFLKDIQILARYLQISNADMEKGSMRLEANISLLSIDDKKSVKNKDIDINTMLPDYKVELKNINSFRFLKNAIMTEVERQTKLLQKGEKVPQETRGYNEKTNSTYTQRSKEEAKDYRYFPEPDIPVFNFSEEFIKNIQDKIIETPWKKRSRYINDFQMNESYAEIIVLDIERCRYFEKLMELSKKYNIGTKTITDLMINKNFDKKFKEPELFIIEILKMIKKDTVGDSDTQSAVISVIGENIKAVEDYKNGKGAVIGFLIGMVQKKLKGKGDIEKIKYSIIKNLNKSNG